MSIRQTFQSPKIRALAFLFLLAACGAFIKLHYLGVTTEGDYGTYVTAAQYLQGHPITEIPSRLLKPLAPLLIALLAPFLGYEGAVLAQALFFYFAFLVALYLLADEFFEDPFTAALATALSILSYPVLKYGVELLTETGGWFFYVLSLWLTLRFLKKPDSNLFFINVLVIIVGFLWKEYSIVAALIFGFALLLHPALELRSKMRYIALYAVMFLAVNVPWQFFMFSTFHYSYAEWYSTGGTVGFATQYRLKNLVKSTAALLGIMWVTVPLGLRGLSTLPAVRKFFLYLSLPLPFIAFAWGYIESRLLYVIAPSFILLSLTGVRGWSRVQQLVLVSVTILANMVWLFLSYSVKL